MVFWGNGFFCPSQWRHWTSMSTAASLMKRVGGIMCTSFHTTKVLWDIWQVLRESWMDTDLNFMSHWGQGFPWSNRDCHLQGHVGNHRQRIMDFATAGAVAGSFLAMLGAPLVNPKKLLRQALEISWHHHGRNNLNSKLALQMRILWHLCSLYRVSAKFIWWFHGRHLGRTNKAQRILRGADCHQGGIAFAPRSLASWLVLTVPIHHVSHDYECWEMPRPTLWWELLARGGVRARITTRLSLQS